MSFLESITKKSKSDQGGVSSKDGTEYSIVSLSTKDDAALDARLFNRVVLIMSIAAMLLSVIPFSALSGLVLGAITLGLFLVYKTKGRSCSSQRRLDSERLRCFLRFNLCRHIRE